MSDYKRKVGFITNEIKENNLRTGFEIETNSGEKSILSHVNFDTNFKVSKYFVDSNNLEKILPRVSEFSEDDLLYIDEIGEMQLRSEDFKRLVLKYLDSQNTCLAIVSKVYDADFIKKIKDRDDVILVEISKEARESKEEFIRNLIKKINEAKKY